MQNKKIIFFVLIVLLVIKSTIAQEAAPFSFYHKIEGDHLLIRWVPNDVENFKQVINNGIKAELLSVDGNLTAPMFKVVRSDHKTALPYLDWNNQLLQTNEDSVALTCVHFDAVSTDFRNSTFIPLEYYKTTDSAWLYRHYFSNYVLGYDWRLIDRSAMGGRYPIDKNVDQYALKLYPTATGDTVFYNINIRSYSPPTVPPVTGAFKGYYAELKWRTFEYKNDFFGFYLDLSVDQGETWKPIFDLPLMNGNDTVPEVDEVLKYSYKRATLPDDTTNVIFRLQGADYLGGRSENISYIERKGNEDIQYSPILTNTIQTDSNYAVIQWEYDKVEAALLQEFRIVVSDTTGKAPELVLESIPPTAREAAVFMKYEANFFRVQAVSKFGTILTSFESLVMRYDADPPAVPENFQGYIDSSGLAHLSWITSDEPDLAGYYLFKGYIKDQELAMITPEPLSGPTHIDSVDMVVGNEWIYYQLRSVDDRGNSSAFTPILSLKKPDVYPPAAPVITQIKASDKSILIRWTTSPSDDVENYRLYRKIRGEQQEWQIIHEFHKNDFIDSYLDTLVTFDRIYQYTLQVTDDDGLNSRFAQMASTQLEDYAIRGAFLDFYAEASFENKSIQLNWDFDEDAREFYLYKGQGNTPLSLFKVLSGKINSITDEKLKNGETYTYVIRAYFANGNASPFSKQLYITME